jgi:hypothetical protein
MKKGIMSLITMDKSALTGIHDKMIVLPNGCCCPFIEGISAENYKVDNENR